MSEEEGISKQAFADAMNVTPGRVSQWLAAGYIDGDALVGSGRSAKIRPAVAREQLRARLDPHHRVRANTKAELDHVAPAAATPMVPPSAPTPRVVSDLEQQIQQERLEGFRRDNRRKAEDEAARRGRYVLASDFSKSVGKTAAMMINLFDGFLGQVASKLSARFGLPQRDVLHVLRSEFRLFRGETSERLRREGDLLPELVEDDPLQGEPPMPDQPNDQAEHERQHDDVN